MGEFDDVLAVELGEEWDRPHGGPPGRGDDHELRATLRLPGAVVELRGEVPAPLLEVVAPLTDPGLHVDSPAMVTLVVQREGPAWAIDGPSGTRVVHGARTEDLAGELLATLDALVVATDPSRLHLDVGCVELDGLGIVVASDPQHPAERHAVVDELVRWGARPVTHRLLTVLPGSHTVFGYPAPGDASAGSPGRAAWRPYTVVDVVVHVAHDGAAPTGAPAATGPLSLPESCMRLLELAVDRGRLGNATLDVVASLAGGASHWEVSGGDAAAIAAAVRAAPAPRRRAFWVMHRFDDVGDGVTSDDQLEGPSLRVARFDDGAVALDAGTGRSLSLTTDEVEALEELLVARPGRGGAGPDARLERLAAHGMHVPDQRVRRPVPGPQAFGLPNCPSGSTARSMWADGASVPAADGGEPDGTTALAVLQGAVPGDEDRHRSAIAVHRRVQDEVVGVERQLLGTLGLLGSGGIEPIVLGSVVQAHDGPLPPYFAESEEIDLLVRDGELPAAIEVLARAGYRAPAGSGDGVTHGVVDLVPESGFGSPVRLRDTLGVGPFGALVDHEEFHRRAVPVRIHGRWCRSLHPEHRFVHACLQLEVDGDGTSTQHVRDVVLAAPRADALMAEAMEASERWGATATVTAAVRRVDSLLPGLSPWIVQRSSRWDAVPEDERRRGGRRARRSVRRG